MACNCLETTLEKVIERHKQNNPADTIIDADYLNKGWNFSGKGNAINLYNEIKIEYTFQKVNGQTSNPKSTKLSIYGEYCGFCGKKFVED